MAERHVALDALRGVAVMGIVLMNAIAFAMPVGAYSNPVAYGGDTAADLWSWAVAFVLVDGKMRAMFSFLFGASMLLVIDRARAAGASGGATHAARMAVLFVIGALHFMLLWEGDILHHYALVGLFALAFVEARPRTLMTFGIGALAIALAFDASVAFDLHLLERQATSGAGDDTAVVAWASISDRIGVPSPAGLMEQLDEALASYPTMVAARTSDFGGRALEGLLDIGVETLGLMLLGMAALRSGFVTGNWARERYRRWALVAYAIGLPPLVALAVLDWRSDFDAMTVYAAANVYAAPFRPIVMLGHVAALLYLITGRQHLSIDRLAAVGRAAFTNYLATSVVMTTFFYGYGFAQFGNLSRVETYALVPLVWLLMLAWSKPWLDRYRFGPAEWVWRSLSRRELQPLRRS